MDKPKTEEQLRMERLQNKSYRAKHTCIAVTAKGDILEQFCEPPEKGDIGPAQGDVMFRWLNGEPQLSRRFREIGYRTFEEHCKESKQPELAEKYREVVLLRLLGRKISGSIDKLIPKSILALRKNRDKATTLDGSSLTDERRRELLESAGLAQAKAKQAEVDAAGSGQ
ncbi:MAG: hypothetical protein AAF721_00395 [Myxococcota bacterium]